jgi:hypothetical protein
VATQRVIRRWLVVGVAAIAAAGCSGGDRGATVVQATTSSLSPVASSAVAVVSDEQEIRDLYAQAVATVRAFDIYAALELKCLKLQPGIRDQFDKLIPPMSTYGTATEFKSAGVDQLVKELAPQFAPVPLATIRPVAEALVANDQAAFDRTMKEVFKQGLRYDISVRDIKVTGNVATAETTTSMKMFTKHSSTQSKQSQLVREAGRWKDCTPNDKGVR